MNGRYEIRREREKKRRQQRKVEEDREQKKKLLVHVHDVHGEKTADNTHTGLITWLDLLSSKFAKDWTSLPDSLTF